MAAQKRSAKDTKGIYTRALDHGTAAVGGQWLRPGFGFDDADDLAWALGFPHVRFLSNEPKFKLPEWKLGIHRIGEFEVAQPESLALRFVRSFQFRPAREGDWDALSKWPIHAKPFVDQKGPPSESEAREIVLQHLQPTSYWYLPSSFPVLVYLLEAFVGPDAVATAFVEALERLPAAELVADRPKFHAATQSLGFVLLRVRGDVSEGLLKRLGKIFDAGVAKMPGKSMKAEKKNAAGVTPLRILRTLDLILHGREAALRSGDGAAAGKPSRSSLLFVHDDPAFVLDTLKARGDDPGGTEPLARLTFLGGESVLDLEQKWIERYVAPGAPATDAMLVEHYGRIQSPKIVPHMLAMVDSGAKRAAMDWFKRHAEFAAPLLRQQKGPRAATAKSVLATLKK